MLSFRSAKESLRDSLTAYLLVAGLGVSLIIMGVTASVYSDRLEQNIRSERLSVLYECADLLRRYDSSERADDRLEASVSFRDAVMRLDCGDELKAALCDYAGELRYGFPELPPSALADEFLLIAASDGDVAGVADTLGLPRGVSLPSVVLPERYLKAQALRDAELLAGGIYGLPALTATDSGYTMSASNLFIDFSGKDGRMTEFFYLPGGVGDIPSLAIELSDGKPGGVEPGGNLCGYRLFRASGSDELRFVVSADGRIAAVLKVKR